MQLTRFSWKLLFVNCFLLLAVSVDKVKNQEVIEDTGDPHDDDLDPADFLAEVHEPSPDITYIHQLSRSFLGITKDILSFSPRSPKTRVMDINSGLITLQELNPEALSELLQERGISLPQAAPMNCPPYAAAYRTIDGSCNNLQFPCWGKAEEPYQRWLPPDYGNGIDDPRVRADGTALPNPRLIYRFVAGDLEPSSETQSPMLTSLITTFGQYFSHEIALTPIAKIKSWDGQKLVDKRLNCCNATTSHPDCLPMTMSFGDAHYKAGHCMEFVRSASYSYRPSSCYPPSLGQRREQLNQLTAFIDASSVYGSTEVEMRELREFNGKGAKLRMSDKRGLKYPPRKPNTVCRSALNTCDKRCHLVGERRSNENPGIASIHTLFARQHNKLVDMFRSKGWDEETLFQVVRKIVGAQMQHIVFNEYLPGILGKRLSSLMNLTVPTPNYQYNPSLNPTLFNVFVTAAFRYGHSMVTGQQKRRGSDYSPVLSQEFFSMDDFCDSTSDTVGRILGGQAETRAQRVDCVFTKELTNHLFAKTPDGVGLDLFSINVQRGRDHGIPPYNKWREACGLPKARNFNDLRNELPNYVIERLQAIYGPDSVDDVDLYVGGISEKPVNDGILGPTFTCIVANQFRNLKYGDRFWYENLNHVGAFSRNQLNEIRKTTLSLLLCENTDLDVIQMFPFLVEGPSNLMHSCRDIVNSLRINPNAW